MKACITTFQSAYNYGAILQAYALQQYLDTNFAKTVILDYHNEDIDKSYQKPSIQYFFKKPKHAIFKVIQHILYKGKHHKIDLFREHYLRLTKRYDEKNINEAEDEGDIFITGSDQVWNNMIIGYDNTYFLKFAKNKRTCSYAASFGISEIQTQFRAFYKAGLENIDYISVRENQGVTLVNKIAERDACLVPDPTLLLECEKWKKLIIKQNEKRRYILVYKITRAEKMLDFARKLSKKTGLPIVYIPNDLKDGIIGTVKFNVGPQEWLGYIDNAEYVVTNSFHGTVFSIIFNKRFFCEVSLKVNPSTSRLMSLLQIFDLEERRIDKFSEELLGKEIDRENVNKILKMQKNSANTFLRQVFSDTEKQLSIKRKVECLARAHR